MSKKSIFMIAGFVSMMWLSSMALGYQQGYSKGSETAWSDARSSLVEPLPTLNLDSTDFLSSNP